MFGSHVLKTWSATQPSISLSSGEAEYYGVVKAAGIAIGQQSLMNDLGASVGVRVWTDSSAAIGICGRSGLGKLRHVQTHTPWVQEMVRTGAIELRKVHGEVNPADLFTKHLSSRDRMIRLVKLFNCEFCDGRADSAPHLRRQQTTAQEGMVAIATGFDSRGLIKTHQTVDAPPPPRQQRRDECSRVGQLDEVKDGSVPHDISMLPHEYGPEDLDAFFP